VIGYDLTHHAYICAPGSFVANEVGIGSCTVTGNYVRTGVQLDSYLLERYAVSVGSYMHFLGMCIDSYGLSMEAKKKITQTFGWLGYGGVRAIDKGATGADTAAGSGSVLTGSNNVGAILINGATPAASIKKFDMGIKNNLRERGALSRQGTLVPGTGSSDVMGSLEAYFDEVTMLDAFLNHSNISIQAGLVDGAGIGFGVYLPKAVAPDGNWNVGGLNQDVMIPLQFVAQRDSTLGFQCQLDYVP